MFRVIKTITPQEEFTDITSDIQKEIELSKINNGLVFIYSLHTTACIKILENETLLKQDMLDFFEHIAPSFGKRYCHNDIKNRDVPPDERLNGHSHIRSMVLNSSEIVPILDGKLELGTWQKIFFIDTDLGHSNRKYGLRILE